jgi:hypothetical protein
MPPLSSPGERTFFGIKLKLHSNKKHGNQKSARNDEEKPKTADNPISGDATDKHPKISPKLAAEAEFKAATRKLNDAMKKTSDQIQVPELELLDHVDEVELTGQELETAIDSVIEARGKKANKQLWKKCIKNWYSALFPYVKPVLSAIKVDIYPSM